MKVTVLAFVGALLVVPCAICLNNGLALKPPMGWNTWTRFLCNVDVVHEDIDQLVSARLISEMAQRFHYDGYRDAGYEYIIIDDCWSSRQRDSSGRLVPHVIRFPRGIRDIADGLHALGLKLGIYTDIGPKTCSGYPGSYGHYDLDAQTFAEWGVDYVKVDGCDMDPARFDELYPQFGAALAKTGRPIVYSCEWPFYQEAIGIVPNYTSIAKTCNMWRNYGDMQYGWQATLNTVQYMAAHQDILVNVSGPGAWTDPDVLTVGGYGMTKNQYKAQMAFWAVLAAPMIMSADLRNISFKDKAILLNKYVIAVNQDPLGIMGKKVANHNGVEVWLRWVMPVSASGKKSAAILIYNGRGVGKEVVQRILLSDLGLDNENGYALSDLFRDNFIFAIKKPDVPVDITVEPQSIQMIKASVL